MIKKRKNKVIKPPDDCPLGRCMGFIGGAWTPNIIWYLSHSPRRFSELKDDLKTIAPKVLSDKLKKMESDGVVDRVVKNTNPPTVEYSLAKLGLEFVPVLEAIVSVGHKLKMSKRG
jgi:DNA-binding HxlR family transcriptional regulator